jgi:hypothetical protein
MATRKGTIQDAAQEWLDRRDRKAHPDGKFDNAGRFYPSTDERCDCCKDVRSPSRSYPYSYMTHCRSAEHVANLYGKDVRRVRRAAHRIEKAQASDGGDIR